MNNLTEIEDDDEVYEEPDLIEIEVFGHSFRVFRGLAEDLITLEKEGAVYSHFWDEASQTFKYYRIRLLPKEVFQYVEAHVAHQEFHDAFTTVTTFEEALTAIHNPMIRERVFAYGNFGKTQLRDGTFDDLRGCAASFYPPEIEALVCGRRLDRYELLPNLEQVDQTSLIIRIIDNFRVGAKLLVERGHNRPPFLIETEYDVQDLLFACVRSLFNDARTEEWTPKHASTSKRVDIVVPSAGVLIEVKYIRNRPHSKSVSDEIKVDIESYHSHPSCKTLLVLIYDPQGHLTDPDSLEMDLSGRRIKVNSSFDVQVMVRR